MKMRIFNIFLYIVKVETSEIKKKKMTIFVIISNLVPYRVLTPVTQFIFNYPGYKSEVAVGSA